MKALAFAKKHGAVPEDVYVEVNGGGVPNSYRYRAESTTLTLSNGVIKAIRGAARKGPRGDVTEVVSRVKMPKPPGGTLPGVVKWHGGHAYLF